MGIHLILVVCTVCAVHMYVSKGCSKVLPLCICISRYYCMYVFDLQLVCSSSALTHLLLKHCSF